MDHLLFLNQVTCFIHQRHQIVDAVRPVIEKLAGAALPLEADDSRQSVYPCINALRHNELGKERFGLLLNKGTKNSSLDHPLTKRDIHKLTAWAQKKKKGKERENQSPQLWLYKSAKPRTRPHLAPYRTGSPGKGLGAS